MATDVPSTPSTAAVVGLLVAGLSAVYAYTQLIAPKPTDTDTLAHVHTIDTDANGAKDMTTSTTRKGKKKKKKGKSVGVGVGDHEGEGQGKDKDQGNGGIEGGLAVAVAFPRVVPGDFEGVGPGSDVGAQMNTDPNVGSQQVSPAGTASKRGNGGKGKSRRKKKAKQGKGQDRDEGGDEGSETGKELGEGAGFPATVPGPRSGDSTDASVSLSPSAPASALPSSRAMGKGNLRASTRLAPPSQPHAQARGRAQSQSREIRSSLSLDTDSSWTHVDHRRLKTSRSADDTARGLSDAVDLTSSDLASTASDSPVAERTDGIATNMHAARADPVLRSLAEKLVPRARKTGVDDMLEQPDFPTLARVMRVQPLADEAPVPGFSWEDYGNVIEESLLVDDADQEDEGEWGVVKSRGRTRTSQTATTTVASHAAAAPQTMTKKQRQNARKRELAKSARAETEQARLEGLAKHKRELERLRIIEQSQQGGGKRPSGGMQASVDDGGKLVWE